MHHTVVWLMITLLSMSAAWADDTSTSAAQPRERLALFLVVDGVYNSELMAPYDVLQHSVFRNPQDFIKTAIVAPSLAPITTFEGIEIRPHYDFDTTPWPEILIVPSTSGSMERDLADQRYIGWIKEAIAHAEWVVTVCDGAFPVAATGALDGRRATTFPADRTRLAEMFPKVTVDHESRLVIDGKFITSVGGAMSYEPAFWLVEHLFGPEHAAATAEGLVWPWDLTKVPHVVVAAPAAAGSE